VAKCTTVIKTTLYIKEKPYSSERLVNLQSAELHTWGVLSSTAGEVKMRQAVSEGQEDQLGAVGLVVNMIVLWNTIYMEAALTQLPFDR
jgi:hypothetical protein